MCAAYKKNIIHLEKKKEKEKKKEIKFRKTEAIQVKANKIESQIKSNKEHTHKIAQKNFKLEVNKI